MRQLGNAINFIENDLYNTYEEEQRQIHFTELHLDFEYFSVANHVHLEFFPIAV